MGFHCTRNLKLRFLQKNIKFKAVLNYIPGFVLFENILQCTFSLSSLRFSHTIFIDMSF